MRFQALLLSLIILISLFITSGNLPFKKTSVKENVQITETKEIKKTNEFAIFLKDLSSALLEKTASANQSLVLLAKTLNQNIINLHQGLLEKINLIGQGLNQDLNQMSKNFKQNLVSLKEILSSKFNNKNDNLENKFYQFYPSAGALTSEAKINILKPSPIFSCQLNQSDFTDFTSKVILIKYFNPSLGPDQIIFELNPEKRWPIASLTKLMTAVVAFEKMNLDKEIVMTEKVVATEGTAGECEVGEVFKLRDLIKVMLVSSSNDAAMAIAEDFGGRDFVNEMQKKAAELKMFSTTYLEPTGLSFINQSTASDLAKLMNYIYFKHPEILEISRQKEIEILDLKSGKKRKILTVNRFAGAPDFIGGKTGYIDEAGRNLISFFEINGKTVLSIVLGSDDSFKETEKLKNLVKSCSDFTYERSE